MKNKVPTIRLLCLICFSLLAFVLRIPICIAQEEKAQGKEEVSKERQKFLDYIRSSPAQRALQLGSRDGTYEIFIMGSFLKGDTTTFGLGMTSELDDGFVGAFGAGYNFNDYFNINADLFFGSNDLTGSAGSISVKSDSKLVGWDLNLDINILKSRFTPMVTGGLGFIEFSGDVGGLPFSELDFSYNVGGGSVGML